MSREICIFDKGSKSWPFSKRINLIISPILTYFHFRLFKHSQGGLRKLYMTFSISKRTELLRRASCDDVKPWGAYNNGNSLSCKSKIEPYTELSEEIEWK